MYQTKGTRESAIDNCRQNRKNQERCKKNQKAPSAHRGNTTYVTGGDTKWKVTAQEAAAAQEAKRRTAKTQKAVGARKAHKPYTETLTRTACTEAAKALKAHKVRIVK